MFINIKHQAGVLLYMVWLSIRKQLAYPINILSCLVMVPMMVATGVLLLYALATRFQTISGWTFEQLAFLYGLGYLSHGLMMVFGAQNIWMDQTVIRGEFDRMLLRPLPVYTQFAATYVNLIGMIDVLLSIGILIWSAGKIGFIWSPVNIVLLFLTVFGATLIRNAIFTMVCSTAFRTRRSAALFWLLTDLMERTTMMPLSIYPVAFQMFISLIVPLAFISYYPACQWLGKSTALTTPWPPAVLTLLIGLVLSLLAARIFNLGLQKYESAGS